MSLVLSWLPAQAMFDLQRKLLFVHIPKNGGAACAQPARALDRNAFELCASCLRRTAHRLGG
jgi:hypothetical protein